MLGWLFLVALVFAQGVGAQTLASRLESLAAETPAARRGYWGAHIVDLTSARVVYARNADSFFVPASNTKLFSTALALTRLGPDYRFLTRVVADGPLTAEGVLQGDLRLIGGGDPTLSGRPLPYRYKAPFGPPLAPLEELARAVVSRGIRRITGDIVGDDSAWIREPYPDGWSQDDPLYSYGAPVSALIIHDNSFTVRVMPGPSEGDPARLTVDPPSAYFTWHNRVTTVGRKAESRLSVDRRPGSAIWEVSGQVPLDGGEAFELAVDDPARYAAFAFRELLLAAGVAVDGQPRALHRLSAGMTAPPEGVELARRTSLPLVETLRVINKVSQNLHAEAVLREVARRQGAEPSRQGGLDELKKFLSEAGVPDSDYDFRDASGLSRLTLVTPSAITRLLRFMARSPHAEAWMSLLPVGGEDGSLAARFQNLTGGRVTGKTGTISHAGALAGYLDTAAGRRLAYSLVVNNAKASGTEIRRFIDRIVVMAIEDAGRASSAATNPQTPTR